jgi:hypothetical protein
VVVDAKPEILGHNLETVERLHPEVRPGGRYWRSISLLGAAKGMDPGRLTKTGIILGMGEEPEEIRQAMADVRKAGVDILTLGQYLRPSAGHIPVARWVPPEEFAHWKAVGEQEMGFAHVESGPLVRSSYHAKEQARQVEAGGPGEIRNVMEPDLGAPAERPPALVQLRAEDVGKRGRAVTETATNTAVLVGFSREDLLGMLRKMLLYRRFEEKAEEAYAIGKIGGFCHLHIGQEAAAEGCVGSLREDDYVISAYREHTQALAKGMHPSTVMAELYGRASGSSAGKGGSMHIFGADRAFMGGHGIVGGQVPLATGMGWAIRYRGEDRVVMCFMGEAAVNQGAFHESLNMAAVWKLPVIYVVENNEYGMGTAFRRVSATKVEERSAAYGIPSSSVNGQDVLEVRRHFDALVAEVREGGGPSVRGGPDLSVQGPFYVRPCFRDLSLERRGGGKDGTGRPHNPPP